MMPDPEPSSEAKPRVERWSIGLKSGGFRELDHKERVQVVNLRQRLEGGVRPLWVGVVWALAGALAGAAYWVELVPAWLAAAALGVLLGSAAGAHWVWGGARKSGLLHCDLARGEVELLYAPGSHTRVDVLPNSGLIVSMNGTPSTRWHTIPVRGVAAPGRSARVEFFAGRSQIERSFERAMTADEMTELTRALARSLYVPLRVFGLTLVAGIIALASRSLSAPTGVVEGARWVALGLLLACVPLVVQRARALRELYADLASGSLKIVAFGADQRLSGSPEVLEYLPRSGRLWTINRNPAPWRIRDDLLRT